MKGEMDFCNFLYMNEIVLKKGGIRQNTKKRFGKRLP